MKKSFLFVLVLGVVSLPVLSSLAIGVEVSGKSYIEYKYDLTRNNEGNDEFAVTRVYLNFKEKVTDKIDFRATTDIKAGSYEGKDNYLMVFIKYLYVTFNDIYPDAKLRIGQTNRPWIGFEEKIWEHRWVSKVFADLEGKLSSTGRGVMLMGKVPQGYGDYAVAYINGAGYHTEESGEYSKDISVRLTLQPLSDKALKLNALYYAGKYDTTGLADATKNRIVGMVSYQADRLTVAAEYLTSDDKGTKGAGGGGFGIFKATDRISPFIRYEIFDPKDDDEHTRIIVGVSYKLRKKVVAAIDYQSEDYKSSAMTDTAQLYLHMRINY
ncbi:MAG: hypothetical protein ACE5IT_08270 [bacterium]